MRRRWKRLVAEPERGSVTIELILATPVLIVFLLLVVSLGQVVSARLTLDGAAASAARAASVATSPEAAVADAQQSVSGGDRSAARRSRWRRTRRTLLLAGTSQ